MDLFLLVEGPTDSPVVTLPLALPGSNGGTAVIPTPARKLPE
jgi:hypothetical protein